VTRRAAWCRPALLALLVVGLGCGSAERRRPPTARSVAATVPLPTPIPALPTIEDRVAQYGAVARARLRPSFDAAGVPYPPARFLLLGLKQERELQLYAAGPDQLLRFVRAYPILGASGVLGPKLREGDKQVPEGVYSIVYLNPNSVAHLSLALNYPNEFDRAQAMEDGRDLTTLGGDIMIHGGWNSVGCLAIGDRNAEDIFVLAADSNWEQAVVVISPVDFRYRSLPRTYRARSPWVPGLYAWLRDQLAPLPPPPRSATSRAATAR
jgi:hypothetical protein